MPKIEVFSFKDFIQKLNKELDKLTKLEGFIKTVKFEFEYELKDGTKELFNMYFDRGDEDNSNEWMFDSDNSFCEIPMNIKVFTDVEEMISVAR